MLITGFNYLNLKNIERFHKSQIVRTQEIIFKTVSLQPSVQYYLLLISAE